MPTVRRSKEEKKKKRSKKTTKERKQERKQERKKESRAPRGAATTNHLVLWCRRCWRWCCLLSPSFFVLVRAPPFSVRRRRRPSARRRRRRRRRLLRCGTIGEEALPRHLAPRSRHSLFRFLLVFAVLLFYLFLFF